MKKKFQLFPFILAILMTISLMMTGCNTQKPESDVISSNTDAAAPTAEVLADQPEQVESITIYAWGPFEWFTINVWAWQDGGENAFEEWPGKAMEDDYENYCFSLSLPGWVDRLIFSNEDGSLKTDEVIVEPGKDLWVLVMDDLSVEVYYEDIWAGMDFNEEYTEPADTIYDDPIYLAAEQDDYETVKSLLPTLTDRSILTNWVFNSFNYDYAIESILNGDYETAIEFFGYCSYDDHREYSVLFRQLVDGDLDGASDTYNSISTYSLESDLKLDWTEIVCLMFGIENDPSNLNYVLMDNYLSQRMRKNQPSITDADLTFGDNSTWDAEGYIGEIEDTSSYIPISDLNALYKQCGSEPNGKVLILRSQKDYPSGKTYHVIDLLTMYYLNCDLYPSSLSEVEYIILANYGYDIVGKYNQTLSSNYASVEDQFTFLRMKGQVELIDPVTGKAIEQSGWLSGTGEPQLHFSDREYQCSNMPETGEYIIAAVEKVCLLNEQAD